MTWNRALIVVLTLSLAFTLGLLLRPRDDRDVPGPDYEAFVARAMKVADRLDEERRAAHGQPLAFVDAAARLRPAVVSIIGGSPSGESSAGTGVIVDAQGHILTNLHVIAGMTWLEVTLASHERYAGRVIGADEPTDLAVLGIDAGGNLFPAPLGDSDAVQVGEEVLAIGNALGFGWSVSHGIISSLHRSRFKNKDSGDYTDYIQTDAAINRGNSGGPLVDRFGRVIGINSVIVSESGASAGVGFALPAQDAWFVARQLIATNAVRRGYLGISGRDLAEVGRRARQTLGADTAEGVLVGTVEPGTPAERAGFRESDVILAMEGRRIEGIQALRSRVARVPIGTELRFSVIRDRREITIVATVALPRDRREG